MIQFPEFLARFDRLPTHLDAPETPVAPEIASPAPETSTSRAELVDTFRHSGWRSHRQAVLDAMVDLRLPHRRIEAFSHCGSDFWIMRSTADQELFRVVPDHCHDRFCVPCGGQRQSTIRRNLNRLLHDEPHRFLTLTIRHDQESLDVLLDRLYRAFRLLRQRRMWKDRVRGGVAFLEVTYDPVKASWNPHLHCMLQGFYLELQALSRLWLCCTGDSHNVKIKLIKQKRVVVDYVTKYATKPLSPSILADAEPLATVIFALSARRMIITFGSWKNWKLLEDPRDQGWALFAHLSDVRRGWQGADELCDNILAMLPTADPNSGEFVVHVENVEPDD